MKKIEFGSDEQFIENYQKLKSAQKMGELYGCSKTTILKHAKDIGYDVNTNKKYKLSTQDKEEILTAYTQNITSTELAKKYSVSRGMITKIWFDAGLSGKQKTITKNIFQEGDRINNLTVLRKTDARNAGGCIMWECLCDCGKITSVSSARLKSGAAKSCGCLSKKSLELGRGQYKDLTQQKFGLLTVLERCEDYILPNGQALVQWLCQCNCGRTTKVLASNLHTGNSQSCGFCGNKSHGNLKIDQLLTENNIPFEREKRFDSCKDKTYLPFDFFVDNKYLIEFDGMQHFEETSFFDSQKTQQHDIIKNQWCKENNIPLIRIPYTHLKELSIQDLILETSKFKI